MCSCHAALTWSGHSESVRMHCPWQMVLLMGRLAPAVQVLPPAAPFAASLLLSSVASAGDEAPRQPLLGIPEGACRDPRTTLECVFSRKARAAFSIR